MMYYQSWLGWPNIFLLIYETNKKKDVQMGVDAHPSLTVNINIIYMKK